MKYVMIAATALAAATAAHADGDAAAGEKEFRKCKSCHTIASADEVIVRGGKTGPNLYGVVGRAAGSVEDFRYGNDLLAAGEAGLVWDEEQITAYIPNPKEYLADVLDKPAAKSKMAGQRVKDPADVAAYLATFSDE
ncbi:c-type cytochrome [Aliiroseovarius sp. PTFE2010]|uniref:c-type cytochrome n=1 Tax=Aliiroseovarius sp. PTFE2010 TaxID=3417190 RepID=UPI003CED8444